jgi:hypothetical protein
MFLIFPTILDPLGLDEFDDIGVLSFTSASPFIVDDDVVYPVEKISLYFNSP